MDTQKERILEHLQSGKTLTKLESLLKFGVWNTGDVIYKLRNEGHIIDTEMVSEKGKTFAQYKLITQ